MNLIERITSKAFYDKGYMYHSVESAKGFFEAKCKMYGLEDWTFKIVSSTSKRNIGYCQWGAKLVAMQAHFFFALTSEQVEEIILHELAHALTPNHGHDPVWKAKARELGCKPAATENIQFAPGFRKEWKIVSGHTRSESTFDVAAFTSSKPAEKRVPKPTQLALSWWHRTVGDKCTFISMMIEEGYRYEYAVVQYKLCQKYRYL